MSRWLLVTIAILVAATTASVSVWFLAFDRLPEQVPTHWGWTAEPDGWTPRGQLLPQMLIMPAFLVFWIFLTAALPWLSPRNFEVSAFRPAYDHLMGLVAVLFGYMHAIILAGYLVPGLDVGRWMVAGMFVFFAMIGNMFGQIRPNFWMGVRTPWTLANSEVWDRTHRFASRLFVIAGVIGLVGVVLGLPLQLAFGVILIAALTPVIYSLVIYKRLERAEKLEVPPAGKPAG